MKENYTVCNCKQVTYWDILDALHDNTNFSDVLQAFESVQKATHCSTGCGTCHDKVMGILSDVLMGHEV